MSDHDLEQGTAGWWEKVRTASNALAAKRQREYLAKRSAMDPGYTKRVNDKRRSVFAERYAKDPVFRAQRRATQKAYVKAHPSVRAAKKLAMERWRTKHKISRLWKAVAEARGPGQFEYYRIEGNIPGTAEWYRRAKRIYNQRAYEKRVLQRDWLLAMKAQETYSPEKLEYLKARRNTPAYKFASYQKGASSRAFSFELSFNQFMAFWQKPCQYCQAPIETIGLDRVDSLVGYQLDNVVSCCSICNKMKLAMSKEEFLQQCARISALAKESGRTQC